MPELPEVETTLRGIEPHIIQQAVTAVDIRHPRLRWPIPKDLLNLTGQSLINLSRRNKYLLFTFPTGTMILHLGMSGRLRVLSEPSTPQIHDHVDIHFANHHFLRFTDPRRFGALLWTVDDPLTHPLLANIGPEPLTSAFNAAYLMKRAKGRSIAVKSFIMDGKVVAGVGNIYATEALFAAGIHPERPAGQVSLTEFETLVPIVKRILRAAIKQGGTTLKDFTQSDGSPGYFSIQLNVYGKAGKPCPNCKTALISIRLGQRGTVFCRKCQK